MLATRSHSARTAQRRAALFCHPRLECLEDRRLMAGLGGHAPIPFNLGISNVPGPTEPLYLNGSRLDALFPLSLLLHGNALNITCVSYAGTLNFGFTGARDNLPHLQRLAVYMGGALEEIEGIVLGKRKRAKAGARQAR